MKTNHSPAAHDHRARAQALFDAVLRSQGKVPDGARLQCALAVTVIGEPFPAVAAARDSTDDPVFDLDPTGAAVEAVLVAALHELGRLPLEQFEAVFEAAEAGHDALLALR